MKLRCTIGSQGFVGGPTYRAGDEYTLEDEEKAKQLIEQGYAEEVKEVTTSAVAPPLIEEKAKQLIEQGYAEEVKEVTTSAVAPPLIEANTAPTIKSDIKKKVKTQRKY